MKRIFSSAALSILMLMSGIAGISCTKPEKHEIQAVPVEYKAADLMMKGYLARPADLKDKHAGILVVHEWWGINSHVKETAERLAALGYTALAVDLYGDGKQADNSEDASKLAQTISGNNEARSSRLGAAMDFLRSQKDVDPAKIAAVGYSFGGYAAVQSALDGADLAGVVSVYGGFLMKVPERSEGVKARILMLHGEKDWYVTPQMLNAFRTAMKDAGIGYDVITYKDAEHGFDNPESDKLAEKFKGMHIKYNKEAAEKSWEDIKKFLSTLFYQA